MTKLVDSAGIVLYEVGPKLFICKRPGQWTGTFLFVTGLLAFILVANGVLQLLVFKNEDTGSTRLGIILLAIGSVVSLVFWRVRLYDKKIRAIPLNELKKIALLDFENNNLLDEQLQVITPLKQAWLQRKMQISSSSPELVISWDRGSLSIVKGNPFSGGIAGIEKVLVSKGIRKR